MEHSNLLTTAIEAARAAQRVIEGYYFGEFDVQLKPDQSPVTVADIEAEKTIKYILMEAFPEHGFYGEETQRERPGADYTWLVDPIDGTKSFVRGYPFFSTQIALMHGNQLVLGVSNAPLMGELACAEQGSGAWLNEERIAVSPVTQVSEATLSLGNIASLAAGPRWQALGDLVRRVDRIRGYGDFYQYHLLAAGKIDAVIESDVNILDVAALSVIVQEAGGAFTDLAGQPLGFDATSVLAASSAELHRQVAGALG